MTTATKRRVSVSWTDLHYSAVDFRTRTARTAKPCGACEDEIEPGQRYVHIVWTFPWTLIADDVDDEGRPCGGPAGEWSTDNVHHACVRIEEP